MENKPELHFSLHANGNVLIGRGENIDDSLWGHVFSWWTDGRQIDQGDDLLEVSIGEFIFQMSWLRTAWTSQDRKVSLTNELKQQLGGVREAQDRFLALATGEFETPDINFDSLNLARTLTAEQTSNVRKLVAMDNGANFSVPGAGKTSTELVIWRYLHTQGRVGGMLVICPRSAFEAWSTEPAQCFTTKVQTQILTNESIDPGTEILIINYEQIERDERLTRICNWIKDNSAMVVLDEAHRVKGGGASVRWRACREITNVATRVDLLTGTPMPQSYEDLRNLLNLSWSQIPRTFFSDARLQSLNRGGVFVRTTKTELGLPKPLIIEEAIPPGKIQDQIYSALCRVYFGTFQLSSTDEQFMTRKGKAVMTLLAAATNPGLLLGLSRSDAYLNLQWPPREVESSTNLLSVIENYAQFEIPPKYEWVRRFVEVAANDGRKVIVWSTFVGNIHALNRILEPFSPAVVYGATSSDDRTNQIDRFRHDASCSVLITNPQTLGEGISLHKTCHDAVYLDRSYNAGLYLQSLDRIHRLGLSPEEETRIYLLGTQGTIDQRVSIRLRAKVDRLAEALDDKELTRASMPDYELVLNRDEVLGIDSLDLDDLFSHLKTDDPSL